jgi:NAD(P)-dependent dehydrogenase (short-subunit alcohol dehydrogenase family)
LSSRIIISASSDIGAALAGSWMSAGHKVTGTYRTRSAAVDDLADSGMTAIDCDLSSHPSIDSACHEISTNSEPWDVLVLAPGLQDPVGPFAETPIEEWEESVTVNFAAQLRIVRRLLDSRNIDAQKDPCVLFFAGGGTNSATVNYSSYTVSKIALIKMCELLDAEIFDVKFTIVGPGWVDTKIHQSTVRAGSKAGDNYKKTIQQLKDGDLVPMQSVVDCCNWVIDSDRSVVGGRNISLVFDRWGDLELDRLLREDPDMYKLRRSGNDRLLGG